MNTILFISVHPDDETFGCGGAILKHKAAGDQIHWLNITGIYKSHPYRFTDERIETRDRLISRIKEEYGFESLHNLLFPTIMLDTIEMGSLITEIDKCFKVIKPEIIYLPNRSDVHSDHRVAFNAIYACTKNFRKPFIKKILMYETLSETEFTPALPENCFIPNFFIDISKFFNRKMEIIALYDTELMPDPYPRSISAVKALAAFRGSRIGVDYAEAFNCLLNIN